MIGKARRAAALLALLLIGATGGPGTPAPSFLDAGYARAASDLWAHYWDGGDRRIRPTEGDGGPRNGLVVEGQRATSFWQMAQYHHFLFGRWHHDRSDAAGAAIMANWAAVRRIYSPAQLGGDGRADGSINVSDDAGWKANFLAEVHAVTRDPEALRDLEEMIPAVTARFGDPNQPRLVHGESPGGHALTSGPHGILYAAEADRSAYASHGRISSLYETPLALAALYAFEQDHAPAYLHYAQATYRWIHADLRNTKQATGDTATGVYLADLVLDPGTLAAGRPQAKDRYFGKPIRGLSAEYEGGTLAMAVLAARLYRVTGDRAYLAEARAIVEAFVRSDAFGRVRDGALVFVNARDPWTDGYWFPEVATEVLPLARVDPRGTFRGALRDTARAILARRTADGYYGGDWSGPERNPLDGTRDWVEASALANGGRGGGQAAPRQIMTSSSSATVVQAAHLLGRRRR